MQILKAASSGRRGRVTESQGAAEPNQPQQPPEAQAERSGAVSIGVGEEGSLAERGTKGPGAMAAEDSREGTGGGEAQVGWISGRALSGRVAREQGGACEAGW